MLEAIKSLFNPVEKKTCEFCGTELVFENKVLTSLPPQYPYWCPKCGAHYVYREDGTRYFLAKWGNRPCTDGCSTNE